jgi:hypothetical protein
MLHRARVAENASLLLFLLVVSLTSASGQDMTTPKWFETLSVNGFISTAYTYNFNKPDTLKNFYRVFDFDDNSIKLDVVEISVKKEATKAEDAGFRMDAIAGSSIPQIVRSSGMDIGDLDFPQVYFSYIAPIGHGLKLDIGKFVTSLGYEVIEGCDGYNDNYSRSLLFGYAIPFTHTGLKATYAFSENLSGMLMLANGWDNAIDNNSSKSVGAQIGLVPTMGMSLSANVMFGPEKPDNNADNRRIFDLSGTYTLSEIVSIGVNGDYGAEEHSTNSGGTAVWDGIAMYLRLNPLKEFSLIARLEQFEDPTGARTSIAQTLREVTLTPEYRFGEQIVVRADLRLDKSDKDVFQAGTNWKNTQTTMGLNFLCSF